MDEGLREELNRAFHSTARAQLVRKQISKVTSIDETSIYEKVTDTFFSFTKSRAENLLRLRYHNIAHFVSSIFPYTDMIPVVEYTIELLHEYAGAVNLLWDMEAISDNTAELYFEFCTELEIELINTKCDMINVGY